MQEAYYLKDHLGNIRVTLDGNGNVVTTDDYYPFGLKLPGRSYNIALTGNQYKYSGKELDEESGLNWYYFGARYYDPILGRWVSVDPRAADRPWESPYSYTGNNPINRYDPDGEFWHIVGGAALGAAISGGLEAYKQYNAGGELNWNAIGAASAEGAINGAVIAAVGPGGLSLTLGKTAWSTAVGGVAAGMTKRAISGDNVADPVQMATDFIANGTGGAVANKTTQVVTGLATSTTAEVVVQKLGTKATEKVAKGLVSGSRSTVKTVVKKVSETIQNVFKEEDKDE